MREGAGSGLHPLSPDRSLHPYVIAASELVRVPGDLDAARRILRRFYGQTPPSSFVEWTGVGAGNPILSTSPPHAIPLPWVDRDTEQQARRSDAVVRTESRSHGQTLTVHKCFPPAGPMTDAALETELRRMNDLVESVRAHGYRVDSTSERSMSVCWWAKIRTSGLGWSATDTIGAAVAAAFGLASVPVAVVGVIRRGTKLCCWPGVIRGTYTPEEALAVFDLIVEGRAVLVR